ncbi:MAG: endonuclease domain-containing protein [Chitinophagaceae bacterium]
MTLKNPYKEGGMFEGASPVVFANAKQLRKNMTASETVLWMHLKKGVDGLKFRRQHPIGLYIADFYCHKVKLILEVDGLIHNQPEVKQTDEIRQKDMERWGYQVLRFTNEQVLKNSEQVIRLIVEKITYLKNLQKLNASPGSGV